MGWFELAAHLTGGRLISVNIWEVRKITALVCKYIPGHSHSCKNLHQLLGNTGGGCQLCRVEWLLDNELHNRTPQAGICSQNGFGAIHRCHLSRSSMNPFSGWLWTLRAHCLASWCSLLAFSTYPTVFSDIPEQAGPLADSLCRLFLAHVVCPREFVGQL